MILQNIYMYSRENNKADGIGHHSVYVYQQLYRVAVNIISGLNPIDS